MSLQNTASKSDLIMGCSRPFQEGIDTSEEVGDAARYGSAVHEILYRGLTEEVTADVIREALTKWGYLRISQELVQEVFQHVKRAVASLLAWMQGGNPWGAQYRIGGAEQHLASRIRVRKDGYAVKSRVTGFDEAEHQYELASYEIGGTYDILLERVMGSAGVELLNGPVNIVVDYKTGESEDFTDPRKPQLLTLAIMTEADGVAILHTPRHAPAVMYAREVGASELTQHARALRAGMRRQGDGSMRPGPWCKHCPARVGCPVKDAELIQEASTMLATVSANQGALFTARDVTPGAMHQFLTSFEKLAKTARDRLKEEVKDGALYQRPDGKMLVLRPGSRENLSQASIKRALGDAKGERLITSLRKKGCIETSNFESLVAVKEDG